MEYLFLVSRILFGGFFIYNGFNHLKHAEGMAGYAASKGVSHAKTMIIISGILILLGGLGIVLGVYVRLAVLLIILFLVPVTYKMHAFWKADPAQKQSEQIAFNKNVALAGAALAYLFISLPWPLALQ